VSDKQEVKIYVYTIIGSDGNTRTAVSDGDYMDGVVSTKGNTWILMGTVDVDISKVKEDGKELVEQNIDRIRLEQEEKIRADFAKLGEQNAS
jgi:hypothetical protein